MDIKSEFTKFCGPSVLYKSHERMHRISGRSLQIVYTIPAISDDERNVHGYLRNGLETVLRRVVRQMADSARNDAYRRTGHREADMVRLLSGRTI